MGAIRLREGLVYASRAIEKIEAGFAEVPAWAHKGWKEG